ncbi:MAG: InlB B-repeat-containing protein [Bacteroidaceae bacterium]|nr:InlB B-repeat-containing protein [Bacteroidaceae bacterium]
MENKSVIDVTNTYFGARVKSIGKEAFSDCNSVTQIISRATTPPTCGVQALDDINKWTCSLIVPKGKIESYQSVEQWKDFFFMEEVEMGFLHKMTYMVDGAEYKTYDYEFGMAVIPEPTPSKEGYTFSGWSELPATMPAEDVTVTGTFTVNKYFIRYYVGDELVAEDEVEYGAEVVLRDYIPEDASRYSFVGWEGEKYETMPAHDIEYHANIADGIADLAGMNGVEAFYDASGRKVAKPKRGVNVLKMKDGSVKKLMAR